MYYIFRFDADKQNQEAPTNFLGYEKMCFRTNLEKAVRKRRKSLQKQFEDIFPGCSERYPTLFPLETFTFQNYLWAHSSFVSRGFPARVAKAPLTDCGCLLPYLDMINHKYRTRISWITTEGTGNPRPTWGPSSVKTLAASPQKEHQDKTIESTILSSSSSSGLDHIAKEPRVLFIAEQAWNKGEEVFNNYGGKGNEEFLMGYGMCLPQNSQDTFIFAMSGGHLSPTQKLVLKKAGLGLEFYLSLNDPLPPALLRAMRISCLSEHEVSMFPLQRPLRRATASVFINKEAGSLISSSGTQTHRDTLEKKDDGASFGLQQPQTPKHTPAALSHKSMIFQAGEDASLRNQITMAEADPLAFISLRNESACLITLYRLLAERYQKLCNALPLLQERAKEEIKAVPGLSSKPLHPPNRPFNAALASEQAQDKQTGGRVCLSRSVSALIHTLRQACKTTSILQNVLLYIEGQSLILEQAMLRIVQSLSRVLDQTERIAPVALSKASTGVLSKETHQWLSTMGVIIHSSLHPSTTTTTRATKRPKVSSAPIEGVPPVLKIQDPLQGSTSPPSDPFAHNASVLLSFPLHLCLGVHTAQRSQTFSQCLALVEGIGEDETIILFLLHHLSKGEQSPLHPFLSQLPQPPSLTGSTSSEEDGQMKDTQENKSLDSHVHSWTDRELSSLAKLAFFVCPGKYNLHQPDAMGPELRNPVTEYLAMRDSLFDLYEQLFPLLFDSAPALFDRAYHTKAHFAWALSILIRYGIEVPLPRNTEASCSAALVRSATMTLLPPFPLCISRTNATGVANAFAAMNLETNALEVIAPSPLPTGSTLCLDGRDNRGHTSLKLFMDHGYWLPANVHDHVKVSPLKMLQSTCTSAAGTITDTHHREGGTATIMDVLKHRGHSNKLYSISAQGRPSPSLLEALQVNCLTTRELERVMSFPPSTPLRIILRPVAPSKPPSSRRQCGSASVQDTSSPVRRVEAAALEGFYQLCESMRLSNVESLHMRALARTPGGKSNVVYASMLQRSIDILTIALSRS